MPAVPKRFSNSCAGNRHDSTQAMPMLRALLSAFLDEAFEAVAMPQLGRALCALAERHGYTLVVVLDGRKLGRELRPAILFTSHVKGTLIDFDKKQPLSRHAVYQRALANDAPFALEELRRERGVAPRIWLQTLPPMLREGETLMLPVHRAQQLVMFVGVSGAKPDDSLLTRATLHTATQVVYDRFVQLRMRGSKRDDLTNREAECMRWIGLGKTDREISDIIGISERTVRYHVRNAKTKLGVTTRVEAIARLVGAARGKRK